MHAQNDSGPSNIIGVLNAVDSAAVTVRQSRCAMVRNRNARCLKCAEACTSGCIHLVDGLLRIDASKCVGCGTCATVCPTCALETHNPSDSELLGNAKKALWENCVAVMCHPCAEACGDAIRKNLVSEVVCLGRVDESLLVQLVVCGAREIELVCGDCEKCAQRQGRACAKVVANSAMDLLALWDLPVNINVEDSVPKRLVAEGHNLSEVSAAIEAHFAHGAANDPIVRQKNLSVSCEGDSAEDTMAERARVLRVMKDGTLPHFRPARRERLLDGLSALGRPSSDCIESRLWGCVALDPQACVSCRMCATFCPTGAIRKYDAEDGSFGVEHYPGDCVKCGTCRDICPAKAITIKDSVRLSYLLDGMVHRYAMRPRPVELNSPHQILNTMKRKISGNVYER